MMPAPLAKLEAMEREMRAARANYMTAVQIHVAQAQQALNRGDHSAAATECHRAYQFELRARTLTELLP
jgi:hypothetical protein